MQILTEKNYFLIGNSFRELLSSRFFINKLKTNASDRKALFEKEVLRNNNY